MLGWDAGMIVISLRSNQLVCQTRFVVSDLVNALVMRWLSLCEISLPVLLKLDLVCVRSHTFTSETV